MRCQTIVFFKVTMHLRRQQIVRFLNSILFTVQIAIFFPKPKLETIPRKASKAFQKQF